jgi:hypothetical protein
MSFRIEPCFHSEYGHITPEPIYPCYSNKAKAFYGHIPPEYMYCSTEYAQKVYDEFGRVSAKISEEDRLARRIDFFVLPKKDDMRKWSASTNEAYYWKNVSLINFIRDQIYGGI